jgi:hypothetical protein
LLFAVACSSTAQGPATTASPNARPPVGSTGPTPVTNAVVPAATCELAIQNFNKHWLTASLQASSHVQAIYANAGTKLTPALLALCQTDAWSPAGRDCIAQAASLNAIDLCTRDFAANQQTHLLTTTAEIIDTVEVTVGPAPANVLGRPHP